jgi:hypothetical protein
MERSFVSFEIGNGKNKKVKNQVRRKPRCHEEMEQAQGVKVLEPVEAWGEVADVVYVAALPQVLAGIVFVQTAANGSPITLERLVLSESVPSAGQL